MLLATTYLIATVAVFWVGALSAVFIGGWLFLILAAVLAGLKVAGIIGWSWWWVTLPIWGAVGWAVTRMALKHSTPP